MGQYYFAILLASTTDEIIGCVRPDDYGADIGPGVVHLGRHAGSHRLVLGEVEWALTAAQGQR